MKTSMDKLLFILSQLSNYKSPLFKMYEAAKSENIDVLEKKIGYFLPKDFKDFLLLTNGAIVLCEDIYGIYNNNKPFDLYSNYLIEKNEVGNPIREGFLPIYPDGFGNHYCLNLNEVSLNSGACNVIFWQHDHEYSNDESPEIEASSFTVFLEKLLKEISENYNYDGTEKIKIN
jgi:cell wall assembly regulator SMI1